MNGLCWGWPEVVRCTDSYYQDYYATVEAYVTACDGKLHDKKYTEYSRDVARAQSGKMPENVAGYDLTKPLGDYEKRFGRLNGPIWALIAPIAQAIPCRRTRRQMYRRPVKYIDRIWSASCLDGGWSLFGGMRQPVLAIISDPDITGMALGTGQVSRSAGGSAGY